MSHKVAFIFFIEIQPSLFTIAPIIKTTTNIIRECSVVTTLYVTIIIIYIDPN